MNESSGEESSRRTRIRESTRRVAEGRARSLRVKDFIRQARGDGESPRQIALALVRAGLFTTGHDAVEAVAQFEQEEAQRYAVALSNAKRYASERIKRLALGSLAVLVIVGISLHYGRVGVGEVVVLLIDIAFTLRTLVMLYRARHDKSPRFPWTALTKPASPPSAPASARCSTFVASLSRPAIIRPAADIAGATSALFESAIARPRRFADRPLHPPIRLSAISKPARVINGRIQTGNDDERQD